MLKVQPSSLSLFTLVNCAKSSDPKFPAIAPAAKCTEDTGCKTDTRFHAWTKWRSMNWCAAMRKPECPPLSFQAHVVKRKCGPLFLKKCWGVSRLCYWWTAGINCSGCPSFSRIRQKKQVLDGNFLLIRDSRRARQQRDTPDQRADSIPGEEQRWGERLRLNLT